MSLICRQLLCVLLLIASSALLVRAQVADRAAVRGRVLDANRAVVPGATVTAVAHRRGETTFTTTDRNGNFFLGLEPDEYALTVAANGFSDAVRTVNLTKTNSVSLEVILEVGEVADNVTVVAGGIYQTDSVSSATRTLTPLREVPQSITVVTKEQIRDQQMQSIGDVVRYTPGLSVHQGENNRDEVIFRGQDSSSSFFLNGVRDDVQYYRDLYNLERLETLKGPTAMVFGRGGGGGVINRVTKEATFFPVREISVTGGSFYNRRVTGDLDEPFGDKVAFRLNSVYENSDSFRKFVRLHRFAINPTLTFTPTNQTRITLGYEFARDRRVADRGMTSFQGRPVDLPIDTYYGDPRNSHVRSNVNIVSGTLDHEIGKFNIHNRTTFGDYDRGYQNFVPGAVNANKTLVSLTAYNNATKRKNVFSQTDLTYLATTGRVRHTLLAGMELGRQLTDNFRNTGFFNNTITSIQASYDNPTIRIPVTFRQSATDANNHLQTNLAATYVQDQVELSPYVQVVAGLRYDYFDLRFHNNRTDDNLRRIDNLVSPRLGLVVKPFTKLSLYGSYSVSYLPSSGDQFSSLTTITQQVKPEKFSNYEVGAKWDLHRNLSFTSALYRLNRTNTRSIDPHNPTAIIQTGSQRTNGFEVGLNGNVTRNWSVAGGYAYQNAFITMATAVAAAGKQVGQVPHNTLTIWNKYQIIPRLEVGLGIISRSDMFVAVDNTVMVPGYTRADAALYYSFNEHWRIQGNIENLLNTRYFANADSNTNLSPGSPRVLRISLSAAF